jgi:hypothetical protein
MREAEAPLVILSGGCYTQPETFRGGPPLFRVYVDWIDVGAFETAQEAAQVLRDAVSDRGPIREIR